MKYFHLSYSMLLIWALMACGRMNEATTLVINNQPVKIKADSVRTIREVIELRYSGTIEPFQTIPISFQSTGTVDNVFVQEGDKVRKGQILATVNKTDNENVYNASVAKYQQAKDAYDRLKSVHDSGSLADIKWVEMETNLKQAESQMLMTKSSLDKCSLRAPADGIIGKRNIEPGQSALSLNAPLEIVKIDNVYVRISVAENEISKIRTGQEATFSISALDGKSFEGKVSNIGVIADKISRTYEVKLLVKNNSLVIKPGMVCDVSLNTNIEKNVLLIPNNAVSKDNDGKPYVFVLSPGKKSVKKQSVTLADYHDNGMEVTGGLSAGEMIVVEGKEKLSDNSLISL